MPDLIIWAIRIANWITYFDYNNLNSYWDDDNIEHWTTLSRHVACDKFNTSARLPPTMSDELADVDKLEVIYW